MHNNILLVDDEETLRYVLRETLVGEGYSVDVANDGFQALERFKHKPYDLLITDIKMHGMDGLQLIREVKRNDSDLKIVIITAYGSLEMVKEATRLGVLEFVSKPFKIQEIKDIITKVLSNQDVIPEDDINKTEQPETGDSEQLTDNFLVPTGLTYSFAGPASLPKSTVVFDTVAISKNRAILMFGNINRQNEKHREWWENKQIGIMVKTIFRSKTSNIPKKIVENIHNFLYKNIQPHIDMSMACVLVDKKKQIIKYVNYGNNLMCSVFTRDGQLKTLESFPYQLGMLPKIEVIEKTIPYSHECRMILSSSNAISEIMERGTFVKKTVENILLSVKNSHKDKFGGINIPSSRNKKKEINFDDETILLIDLDWDYSKSRN